jgi:hypothetical protein
VDEAADLVEAQAQIRAGLAIVAAMEGDFATARDCNHCQIMWRAIRAKVLARQHAFEEARGGCRR